MMRTTMDRMGTPAAALALVLAVTLSMTMPGAATAQARDASMGAPAVPRDASPAGAAVGAVTFGTIGLIAGVYLGAQGDCYEFCGGIVWGGLIGEALGVALGAHLGNRGRGNLAATIGTSAALSGLGIAMVAASDSGEMLGVAALGHVIGVVAAEVMTSPRRSVSAGPFPVLSGEGAGVGVGVTVRW